MSAINPARARRWQLVVLPLLLAASACSWAPPASEQPARSPVSAEPPVQARAGPAAARQNPVITIARSMLGKPYRYGGHSPRDGFDCSGLVYFAHRHNGISVPRTAQAQFDFSTPVRRDQLRPGDLMFFRTSGRQVSHVGFYLGPGRFLHAPGTGKQVSIADYRSTYWRSRYAGAGRISP